MKSLSLTILVIAGFSSCTILFDRFPKNTLNEFPKEITGKYLFTSRKDNDSSYVTITSHAIAFSDNKIQRSGGLSDSLKLAKGEKFYFLCWGDSLKTRYVWDVYPFKISGSKFYIYALDANYYEKSIKKHFKAIQGFDDLYIMDESQLDHFCKKKLKNKNALKMIKVE